MFDNENEDADPRWEELITSGAAAMMQVQGMDTRQLINAISQARPVLTEIVKVMVTLDEEENGEMAGIGMVLTLIERLMERAQYKLQFTVPVEDHRVGTNGLRVRISSPDAGIMIDQQFDFLVFSGGNNDSNVLQNAGYGQPERLALTTSSVIAMAKKHGVLDMAITMSETALSEPDYHFRRTLGLEGGEEDNLN